MAKIRHSGNGLVGFQNYNRHAKKASTALSLKRVMTRRAFKVC